MNSSEADPFLSPSSLNRLRNRLESHIQLTISEMVAEIDPALRIHAIGDVVQHHLENPGKRLRSLLFLLTLQALDPDYRLDDGSFRIAAGIEFFHDFLLIHDDLIDSSCTRRGAPTLWRRLETDLSLPVARARSIATILGDLLHAQAIDGVATASIAPSVRVDLIHTLMAAAGQTGWGAVAEIQLAEAPILQASETSIRAVYQAKTTRYTFEAPMVLAAIVNRAPMNLRETLAAIARPLGLAFQIENDLHELVQLKHPRHPVPVDLQDHVKTLPMVHLYGLLQPDDRERLEVCLSGPLDETSRSVFTELIEANGLIDSMQDTIDETFEQPFQILDGADLNPTCRERLCEIVRFVHANRNHSEA